MKVSKYLTTLLLSPIQARSVHIWWRRKKGKSASPLPVLFDESSALLVASRLARPRYDSACPSSSAGSSLDASAELSSSGGSDTLDKESGQYRQPPLLVPQLIAGKYAVVKDLEDSTCRDTMQKGESVLASKLNI